MTDHNPFAAQQSGEMLGDEYVNPYAAPQSDQILGAGDPQAGVGVGRDGPVLIMLKEATLPPRCVKCNAPTTFFLKRSLSWHHPLIYILVLVSLLVYVIVALIVRHTAKIHVGLCDVHRRSRRNAIAVAWLVSLAAIGMVVVGFAEQRLVALVVIGFVAILFGLLYGLIRARTVLPKRIDKQYVWLKGVCPDYLAELPDWIAPDSPR